MGRLNNSIKLLLRWCYWCWCSVFNAYTPATKKIVKSQHYFNIESIILSSKSITGFSLKKASVYQQNQRLQHKQLFMSLYRNIVAPQKANFVISVQFATMPIIWWFFCLSLLEIMLLSTNIIKFSSALSMLPAD